MTKQDIIGIVLPILPEHIAGIFNEHRDVLIKFTSRVPERLENFRLRAGMKVVLYVSHSGRKLAGEAEIGLVEFLSPHDAIIKYRDRLMLSESELNNYVRQQPGRTEKPILVLSLKKLRTYPQGVTYFKNISMVGEYLTREVYSKILSSGN